MLQCKYYLFPTETQVKFLQQVCLEAAQASSIITKDKVPLHTTQAFIGLGLMGSHATIDRVIDKLTELRNLNSAVPLTLEWMVHPGYSQKEGVGDDFSYGSDREWEMALYKNRNLISMLKDNQVTLLSWADIVRI
jgi:hypothetical protein